MKWIIYRILVTYYHYKRVHCVGYGLWSCWDYAGTFIENYFEDCDWKSIRQDAEFAVDEDLTYWND